MKGAVCPVCRVPPVRPVETDALEPTERPAFLVSPDSRRRSAPRPRLLFAIPARPVLPANPDDPEIPVDPDGLGTQGDLAETGTRDGPDPRVLPVLLAHLDSRDAQENPAAQLTTSPADPASPDALASLADLACPETRGVRAGTGIRDSRAREDLPVTPADQDSRAEMDPRAQPAHPVDPASAGSVPSTAPWTVVFSSRTGPSGNRSLTSLLTHFSSSTPFHSANSLCLLSNNIVNHVSVIN